MTLCCQLKKEYLLTTRQIFQEGEKYPCKSPFVARIARKTFYLDQQYMIIKKKVCLSCRVFWEELKETFERINLSN